MNNKAIFPGTFDPFTNGHLDLVTRAARVFDHIVLAVAKNPSKRPLFDVHERIAFAVQATKHLPNVRVIGFSDLVTNLAYQQKARVLIRGVRAISDLEHEMQLAKFNRYLMKELETILMMPSGSWSYISSTLVKEIAIHGGNINRFLPASIVEQFLLKLQANT